MEKFSKEQIEQFLKIEKEIIGSADHSAISNKGFWGDEEEGGGTITLLTTYTH